MAALYVEDIRASAVALKINSNERCNRYFIVQFMRDLGINFGNYVFTNDTMRFKHCGRDFVLRFDDESQIVSLTFNDHLWCECIGYRDFHMIFEFDETELPNLTAVNASNPSICTLTQANTLLTCIQLQFYFVLLRAAELNIDPSYSENLLKSIGKESLSSHPLCPDPAAPNLTRYC